MSRLVIFRPAKNGVAMFLLWPMEMVDERGGMGMYSNGYTTWLGFRRRASLREKLATQQFPRTFSGALLRLLTHLLATLLFHHGQVPTCASPEGRGGEKTDS
jgi:hypothetical protein